MVTKKEALILGVLAIGGVAVASSIAGGGDGVVKPQQRYGTIMGSQTPQTAPTIYNLPAAAAVTFPEAPTFDIGRFLAPQEEPARGTAGVSAAPKKFYKPGAYVTPVPVTVGGKETYVAATTFPAALGIHRALETARSYGGGGGGGVKKTSAPAKKTPSPARKKAERSYAKSVSIAYGK